MIDLLPGICSSSAIGWFSKLSCSFSAYNKERVTASKVNIILGMINVNMNLYEWLGVVGVFHVVFLIPHDTVTLRYCWSWSDSSEPTTSHSAVPHRRGQQYHYLPLHTARQDGTKQHVCNFIADTILTHTHTQWPVRHQGPKATDMVISHPEITVVWCCEKSASVSITHPGQQEPLWPHPVNQCLAEESWSFSWKLRSDRQRDGETGEGGQGKEKRYLRRKNDKGQM